MSEQTCTIQTNTTKDEKFRQIRTLFDELLEDDDSFSYMMKLFADAYEKKNKS